MSESKVTSPYTAPETQLEVKENQEASMRLASPGQRILNYFIDYFGSSFFAGIVAGFLKASQGMALTEGLEMGLIFLIIFGNYMLEAINGKTVAKYITGTKAVSHDGQKLSFLQALGRTVCRLIPFEVFSFLGGQAGECVGWHDKIPKTRVIKTR